MSDEALCADYYRHQAHVCHTLAAAAPAFTPLYARLHSLAKSYEEKAKAADLKSGGRQETEARDR